jgi:ethanolamine kinase
MSLISVDETITEEHVEQLYIETNTFSLASHFYWGLWALVQAELSNINFDYMSYAILRFAEYKRRKPQFL